jgi:ketosteroid isomerase-like protein
VDYNPCMKLLPLVLTAAFCFGCQSFRTHKVDRDRAAVASTSEAIRVAYTRGDVTGVLTYQHPDVVKVSSSGKVINGRDALKEGLVSVFQNTVLQWRENHVENLWIRGDTAVEQTSFAIEVRPKTHGYPFVLKGRTQVVYVRYKDSPTGWACIRELMQSAPQP